MRAMGKKSVYLAAELAAAHTARETRGFLGIMRRVEAEGRPGLCHLLCGIAAALRDFVVGEEAAEECLALCEERDRTPVRGCRSRRRGLGFREWEGPQVGGAEVPTVRVV